MANSSANGNRPTLLRRVVRLLVLVILGIVIMVPLIYLGQQLVWAAQEFTVGYRQNVRRLVQAEAQLQTLDNRTSLLRQDVAGLMDDNQEQQIALQRLVASREGLSNQVGSLDERLGSVERDLASALTQQAERVAQLEESLMTLEAQLGEHGGNLALLNESVSTLQSDINNTNTQLDQLGGEVDALSTTASTVQLEVEQSRLETAARISETVTTLRTDLTEELAIPASDMSRVLRIFRVWTYVSRARLRLAENNLGLASADIQLALDHLETINTVDITTELDTVRQRLQLAAASLPEAAATATGDLNTAWQALDAALTVTLEQVEAATSPAQTVEAGAGSVEAAQGTVEEETTPASEDSGDQAAEGGENGADSGGGQESGNSEAGGNGNGG